MYPIKRCGILIALLLGLASPAAAQETPTWTALLYDSTMGTLTYAHSDGSFERALTLPLSQGFNAYSPSIVMSRSGQFALYLGVDTTSDIANRQVFVFDLYLEYLTAIYALSPDAQYTQIDFTDNSGIFDESTNRVAFSYALFESSGQQINLSWQIAVLDYRTGQVAALLTSADSASSAAGPNPNVLPVIHRFENSEILFSTLFLGTEGLPEYPAFAWNVDTGSLTPDSRYPSLNNAYWFPTGEILTPLGDERLPQGPLPDGPVFAVNTVQVYDPVTHSRFPFYNDAQRIIGGAYFVQNGERILVSAFDPTGEGGPVWTLLGRDGSRVIDLTLPPSVQRVISTPDGFAYSDYRAEGVTLYHINTRTGDFTPAAVWSSQPGSNANLVHIFHNTPAPEAYTPWVRLADPLPLDE